MNSLVIRRTLTVRALMICLLVAAPGAYCADEQEKVAPAKGCKGVLCEQVSKATEGFKDITATAVVDYKNDEVLAKIGKKYAQQYELKKAMIRFKAPDKTRLDGSLGALKFTYITNHDFSIVKVKPINYEKKESITDRPHRRQAAIDLGLVTKDVWDDYVVEEKGTDGQGDGACYILDLTRGDKFSNLHRIWVKKQNLCMTKMEKYDPDKVTLRLFYKYSDPKLVNGFWVPTKIEMFSAGGELAGSTKIQDIKVNTGLEDSLFR